MFSNAINEEQTHLAERELSAFIAAVTELFGPEPTEDWLDESELMDSPPRSEARNWRVVGDPLDDENYVIAVRKDSPTLLQNVNAVIDELKGNGKLEEMEMENF